MADMGDTGDTPDMDISEDELDITESALVTDSHIITTEYTTVAHTGKLS
jgi:hypothetical protein